MIDLLRRSGVERRNGYGGVGPPNGTRRRGSGEEVVHVDDSCCRTRARLENAASSSVRQWGALTDSDDDTSPTIIYQRIGVSLSRILFCEKMIHQNFHTSLPIVCGASKAKRKNPDKPNFFWCESVRTERERER